MPAVAELRNRIMAEKKLELDRLVFFCDAVVAIAITLLALDLNIDQTTDGQLRFADFVNIRHSLFAFCLSFLNIAIFWKVHHQMFSYIIKIDSSILWYNIGWLLFIVLLPFTTSLVSDYFHDSPAMFIYCLNTLFIKVFQSKLWNYVAVRPEYIKDDLDKSTNDSYRLSLNVSMINAGLACIVAFISPLVAFILLFMRLPMTALAGRILKKHQNDNKHKQ
jgi:uncharacterized membrane protein